MKARVLVLRAAGINGDLELEAAFQWVGAQTERVHINALSRGDKKLNEFDVLALPGGFSYGDHIAGGRVLANEVRKLRGLKEFVSQGKPVLGICNGFQVLVKSGLLPGNPGDPQTVSLTFNASGRFECRWTKVKVEGKGLFTKGLPDVIDLPVAHGEGRFVAPDKVLDSIDSQVVFRYVDNPSGAMRDIAGLSNRKGNVLGLMPHPERFLTALHHPTRKKVPDRELGLQIIKNCVDHVK
ncbi:MAG: phosphoribosylformylglycinamidine synthase I [Deltaproteobacteria bacterium]|nr:phosphoribosylformylglycinamidine synthase I [Deltaproteobacteria bacterium]